MHHVLLEVRILPITCRALLDGGSLCSALPSSPPQVDVLEGTLQCPESGRLFPISRGIPNMLLNDDETET